MKPRTVAALALSVLLVLPASGGALEPVEEYRFAPVGADEGLAATKVYAIVQDPAGFLWIGTSGGLFRYDGTRIRVWRNDPARPDSLPRNFVTSLAIDRTGDLWIGTDGGGLCRYLGWKDAFETWSVRAEDPARRLPDDSVWGLLPDSRGYLWVATANGLARLSPDRGKTETFRANRAAPSRGPAGDNLWPLAEGRDGSVWIGTDGDGLSRWNPASGTFDHWRHDPDDPSSLPSDAIFSLLVDSRGTLWIGMAGGGLARLDAEGKRFASWRAEAGKPDSLSHDTVRSIREDGRGKIWVGTTDGLCLFDPVAGSFRVFPSGPNGLGPSDPRVQAIFVDSSGVTWFGTRSGVDKLVRSRFQRLSTGAGARRDDVRAILAESDGSTWIGSYGGLELRRGDSTSAIFSDAICYALLRDSRGRLWTGRDDGLFLVEGRKAVAVSKGHATIALMEDPFGAIWFGTEGRGFGRVSPEGNVTTFRPVRADGTPLDDATVTGFAWSDGLLVGTLGAGLNRVDPGTFVVTRAASVGGDFVSAICPASRAPSGRPDARGSRPPVAWLGVESLGFGPYFEGRFEALPGTAGLATRAVVEDSKGRAWFATDRGVYRFDPATNELVAFSVENGLYRPSFNASASCAAPDGSIWFGRIDGLMRIDPEAASPDAFRAPFALEGFTADAPGIDAIGGRERGEVRLDTDSPFLRVRVSVFDYRFPKANRVAWRSGDGPWQDAGPDGEVVFSNLAPGTHRLQFRVTNSDGVWNSMIREIFVEVPPPWWLRWYMIVVWAAALGLAVLAYVRAKTAEQRATIRKQEALVEARTAELREAKSALERAYSDKTVFFVNLAHETRTPLTFIRNYLDRAIRAHPGDEDLEIVRFHVGKLVRDMVNFLDAEKVERGAMDYDHSRACDLSALAESSVPVLREACARRGLRFAADVETGVAARGDPYAIDRVLNNLVDNALKYGREGGSIELRVRNDGDRAILEVADHGPGVPPEKRSSIFERYYQISNPKERAQGVGMGLYIVRAIMEAAGGSIEVRETPGGGATFVASFPRAEGTVAPDGGHAAGALAAGAVPGRFAADETLSPPPPERPSGDGAFLPERRALLCVDDDPGLLALLRSSFEERWNVLTARDGAEALRRIDEGPEPDVILSDIMMAGMDGRAFLTALRESPHGHVPLVFLTAKTEREETLGALRDGALDFVRKPFSEEELVAKVESIADNRDRALAAMEKEMRERIVAELAASGKGGREDAAADAEAREEAALARFAETWGVSPREVEVVRLLSRGLLNKEIADRLGLSVRTVEKHVFNVYRKTSAQNKVELVNKLKG